MVEITHTHGLIEHGANLDGAALFAQRLGWSCTIVRHPRRPDERERFYVFASGVLVEGEVEVDDETRAYWARRLATW